MVWKPLEKRPSLGRLVSHVLLSFLLLIHLSGCVTGLTESRTLSEDVRANLGTIGIIIPNYGPNHNIELSAEEKGKVLKVLKRSAKGAGKGAATGGATGIVIGGPGLQSCSGPPVLCGLGILWFLAALVTATTIGLLVGGIYGAIAGTTSQEAVPAENRSLPQQIENEFQNTLKSLRAQESLRSYFLQEAKERTALPFVTLDEESPGTRTETINYRSLRSRGIDTAMELSIETMAFKGNWTIKDPPLSLQVTAKGKLVRTNDEKVLKEDFYTYTSEGLPYSQWVFAEGHWFKYYLEEGYRTLAHQIVQETFIAAPNSNLPNKL